MNQRNSIKALCKSSSDFLFAIVFSSYPVLFLFFNNYSNLKYSQLLLPLSISYCTSALIFFFFKVLLVLNIRIENIRLIVPLTSICLFSYGYMHHLLNESTLVSPIFGRHRILICIFLVFLLFLVILIHKAGKNVQSFLTTFIILLNLLPIIKKSSSLKTRDSNKVIESESFGEVKTGTEDDPDIYFLIVDMYPNTYTLKKHFSFNNYLFINDLKDFGFTVFDSSMSNYSRTILSLSSTLNMSYINLDSIVGTEQNAMSYLKGTLEHNTVATFLKNRGYNYYWFEGGYLEAKEKPEVKDFYLKSTQFNNLASNATTSDNDFFLLFVNNSILLPFAPHINILASEVYRQRILNVFEGLPLLNLKNDKKFVIAHIMSPHPPYLFNENGEKVFKTQEDSLHRTFFVNQLAFINKKLSETLKIMTSISNGRDKIIILQGDHGTRELAPNDRFITGEEWVKEAFGNLNAIYYSDSLKKNGIKYFSSVNTFRHVFRSQFDSKLQNTEDVKFYTDFKFPLKLTKIN